MFKFYKIIFLFLIIFNYSAFGFSVSVNSNCANSAIPYSFQRYAHNADIKIKINQYETSPDFTFKVLSNEIGADIVVSDKDIGELTVCKSYKGKTIRISKYGSDPDFTIKVSKYGFGSDYTIFNNSKILTAEEVISILVLRNFIDLD